MGACHATCGPGTSASPSWVCVRASGHVGAHLAVMYWPNEADIGSEMEDYQVACDTLRASVPMLKPAPRRRGRSRG